LRISAIRSNNGKQTPDYHRRTVFTVRRFCFLSEEIEECRCGDKERNKTSKKSGFTEEKIDNPLAFMRTPVYN